MRLKEVLLGLVELHPGVTGYELKRVIGESTGYFFGASLGQIYPALKELADEGLVVFAVEGTDGGRDRKCYTTTVQGRAELARILDQLEPLPQSLAAFGQFLLHLTFIGHLDDAKVITYVEAQLQHFRGERSRVLNDQLGVERRYLNAQGAARDRHLMIWEAEYQFLVDDLDRKVHWIEGLLGQLRAAAGLPSDGRAAD